MLTKAREKWKRPEWISPDTWTGLEAFWKSSYFLKSYNQNFAKQGIKQNDLQICGFVLQKRNNFDGEIELQRERFTFDGEREPLMGEVEFDVRGGG
ncbi:hypothetical protein MTR_4g069460 [Medicago truncatula]|uniref:Uncharacterized protein n=1 Tax=Medicago truncatula TaxID=3880 RepID=A0A072UN15_MEDTR|nr:hypothetical protein MTR_4g069460 [Medicago truncatula]